MSILVTGASGFLGSILTMKLLEKGYKVYGLSRHPSPRIGALIPLAGDITKPNLGLTDVPKDIHCVHHLAAEHRLGGDPNGEIWQTNVSGTANVINLCAKNNISHLYFTSTAYTQGRNPYEKSKSLCETMIRHSDIPKVTVFKPSIVMGTAEYHYPGHFSQFVSILIKTLRRAGLIKSSIEGALGLPILEFALRIKGNPLGKLNLVPVDVVADAMARIEDEGTFWLTNPNPPLLEDLVEWVGEFISFDFRIVPKFNPRPLEVQLLKMVSAFAPYLEGDDFPSHITNCPPVTRELIHQTVLNSLS